MNTAMNELELQRLVDGELSQAEQQNLLRRLDESPGDWRTVALAFVEQQVFADASRELLAESAMPARVAMRAELKSPRTLWPTVVAAVALGIGLGLLSGGLMTSLRPGSSDAVVDADNPIDQSDQATDAVLEPVPVMSLEFANAGREDDAWSIPVYDPKDVNDDYWNVENIVPPEVRSAFSKEGYRVDHHREFYSIPLDDGRRVAVPVDTVQVRYAGL